MITVYSNGREVPVNMVEFSDGALTFKLDELPNIPEYISVSVCPTTPVYRVREELNLIVSCIINFYNVLDLYDLSFDVDLHISYLPYGRADRVFEKGNPSALDEFLHWLFDIGFSNIYIADAHNVEAVNRIAPHINNKTQLSCFKSSLPYDFNVKYDYVIAPDKGAVEKAKTIADYLNVPIVYASKKRDVSTGKLTEMLLPDVDFKEKTVLIPDDISDGMGTHVWLADELKKAGVDKVDLYITHLIASKGLNCCKDKIDKIYFYQAVGNYINREDVLKFNERK